MRIRRGIKTQFEMSYPVMSVYEFQFLKEEKEVIEWWKDSSIYIICQAPVLYFDELLYVDGVIELKIKQRGNGKALGIKIPTNSVNPCFGSGDSFFSNIHYFDRESAKAADKKGPFFNVAGIKFFDEKLQFLFWLTPERLIHEVIKMKIQASVQGDFADFIQYRAHYIGQAQKQGIWERLEKHEKLEKILSTEFPFIKGEFPPWELALVFLRLTGAETFTLIEQEHPGEPGQSEEEAIEKFDECCTPIDFAAVDPKIINDFEAWLINFFLPKHNDKMYLTYPNIGSGLKSLGFDIIDHTFSTFAAFSTDEARVEIEINPVSRPMPKRVEG